MIWKIAKKDFLLNLMTFKFAVRTILCIVLVAVFTPVLMVDYQQRLEHYNQAVANNTAELGQAKVVLLAIVSTEIAALENFKHLELDQWKGTSISPLACLPNHD